MARALPFESRRFEPTPFHDFADAEAALLERRFDVVILDIFRGRGGPTPPSPGFDIIHRIKRTTFIPIVVYTALPDRVEQIRSPFIRVLGKLSGLDALEAEVRQLLGWRLPQLARALREAFDETLRNYMWEFVEPHWGEFEAIVDKPDFGRLVVQRLAAAYSTEGAAGVLRAAYGAEVPLAPPDKVHAASFYVMPPTHGGLRLGDIRKGVDSRGSVRYLVVLQPSCDTVQSKGDALGKGARTPNVADVLCALAYPKPKPDHKSEHEFPMPPFLAIPELLIEFRELVVVPFDDLIRLECVATVASPFAEQLAARFAAYIGRIGTPDLLPPAGSGP
jgi:hypothetical protein